MPDIPSTPAGTRFLLTAASFVVVVAGMKTAAPILVPFLLAMFIAIICFPSLSLMKRKGVPTFLAILVILAVVITATVFLGILAGTAVNSFVASMPAYQARLTEKTGNLIRWLQDHGVEVTQETLRGYFNPGTAIQMIGNTLTGLSGVLTNTFMILLTVVFILLEGSGFPAKLKSALARPDKSLTSLNRFTNSVNRYLAIKTLFSLITGVLVYIWLQILGVDYALLWGVLAFLLNFVPNIGSIIAAVPPVLLAVVQLSVGSALLTAGGYLVVNILIGSILEPRFMGEGLGLSTLVVFLSLVFWGWVLGPVGMLLSVPLTMVLKIALESNDDTRWIAVLLGS